MRFALLLFLVVQALMAHAQDASPFNDFDRQRVRLSQRATYVLGGGALASMASGLLISANAVRESEAWHFGNMTLGWGAINLGITIPGLIALRTEARSTRDIPGIFNAQRRSEQIYLINAGLDLGYIGLGLWMQERGQRPGIDNAARLRGWGNAILVQGGFLLAYDLVAFVAHARHWDRQRDGLYHHLQFNGNSLTYRF